MDVQVPNFFGEETPLNELKFFFLFCPNNSGTTILSQYLASQIDGYLPPFGNNEGQMMPEVMEMMRQKPWAADQAYDWRFIRSHWESLTSDRVFVEASPPNLMRVAQIAPVFGRDSTALVSICNPYQQIASAMRRYANMPGKVARNWLKKARGIRKIRQEYPFFPFLSYEAFTANPTALNDLLGLPSRAAQLAGKRGSEMAGISSSHTRSIAFLTAQDVAAATEILQTEPDLMRFFGYDLAGPDMLDQLRTDDPDEFAIGQARRAAWDENR